nr:unnamed protein product [Digitaria exilis]
MGKRGGPMREASKRDGDEIYLSRYSTCSYTDVNAAAETADSEEENTKDLVETCRQLSRYMMYLLVNHPSLLPLRVSAVDTLRRCQSTNLKDDVLDQLGGFQALPSSKEILKELRDLWTRLIIYAAAKSRPEVHTTHLAKRGEPLTYVWLLLAHLKLGDLGSPRLEFINHGPTDPIRYAIHVQNNNSD